MDNEDDQQNNPEKMAERNKAKLSMVEVVNNFVLPQELNILLPLSNPEEQYIQLQELTQKAYSMHFESSGIADKIRTLKETSLSTDLDLQALKIISDIASQGESAWKATFPNTREPEMGMDCTMASAMLTLALGELGFSGVRTVLRGGHYEVMRETGDKKIRLYDPATRVTPTGGVTSGYSREFDGIDLVPDDNGGLKFAITLDQPDMPGGIRDEADGKFIRNFYAEPVGILVDVAIVLSNIDSLNKGAQKKDDESKESTTSEDIWRKQAVEISNKYPSIADLDFKKLKTEIKFVDPYDQLTVDQKKEIGQNPSSESVNGNKLPENWPKIATTDELQQAYSRLEKYAEEDRPMVINEYSYVLNSPDNTKQLAYEAISYSNDPSHPEFNVLKSRFDEFQPEVIVYLDTVNPWVGETRDENIQIGREFGYMRYLAAEHNNNLKPEQRPIEVISGDVSFDEWCDGLRESGLTSEDIALFDIARNVYRRAEDARRASQDLDQAEVQFKEVFQDSNSSLFKELSLIPRSDGKAWTYELAQEEYKNRTGSELTFVDNNSTSEKKYIETMSDIVSIEADFKDSRMIRKIAEVSKKYNNVMAVAGSSHVIRQEKALREYFEDEPKLS